MKIMLIIKFEKAYIDKIPNARNHNYEFTLLKWKVNDTVDKYFYREITEERQVILVRV